MSRLVVRAGRPPVREREARRAARREALLDAAVAAIAARGDEVTMSAMAAEAGVTKPVLYRYFGDRAGLYEALAARYAAGLLTDLRGALAGGSGGRAALEAGVDAYLAYVEAHAELYRFLVTRLPVADPNGPRLVRGFLHRVADEMAGVLGDPLSAVGVDRAGAELLAFGITGMVQLAGEMWLERRTMPRRAAVRYLCDLLWSGLTGPLGPGMERTAHP